MANQSDHNKWADEIFNNALNQAQTKGFRILDDNVNESIIKSKEEEITNRVYLPPVLSSAPALGSVGGPAETKAHERINRHGVIIINVVLV